MGGSILAPSPLRSPEHFPDRRMTHLAWKARGRRAAWPGPRESVRPGHGRVGGTAHPQRAIPARGWGPAGTGALAMGVSGARPTREERLLHVAGGSGTREPRTRPGARWGGLRGGEPGPWHGIPQSSEQCRSAWRHFARRAHPRHARGGTLRAGRAPGTPVSRLPGIREAWTRTCLDSASREPVTYGLGRVLCCKTRSSKPKNLLLLSVPR